MDPRLDERELQLVTKARAAAEEVVAAEAATIDSDNEASRDVVTKLGAAGLVGTCVGTEHGGAGGGLLELALVAEEIGRVSASVASIAVHEIVATRLIEAAGDDGQKGRILPGVAGGELLIAFAVDAGGSILDDPGVGATAAVDGDGYRLEGEIKGVASATIADLFLVPARRTDNEAAVDLFVVEAETDGLRIDGEKAKLGLNGSGLATVHLDGVSVDARARLGESDAAEALAQALDTARLGHAALCVGISQAALEAATESAGAPDQDLGQSQSVQWMLADTATETEAARLLTWYAASRLPGEEFRQAAAMARLVAADTAVKATRRGVQVARDGASRAAGVERLYRDAKAMEIHHGASEAQRMAIARGLLPDLFEDHPGDR